MYPHYREKLMLSIDVGIGSLFHELHIEMLHLVYTCSKDVPEEIELELTKLLKRYKLVFNRFLSEENGSQSIYVSYKV